MSVLAGAFVLASTLCVRSGGGGWTPAEVDVHPDITGYFPRMRELASVRGELLGNDPSLRAISRKVGVTPTTVAKWLRDGAFPQDVDKVLELVRLVRAEALRQHKVAPRLDALLDEQAWREAYQEEARKRAGVVSEAVLAAQAREVLADGRVGRPVSAYAANPLLLEVHRAIDLGPVSTGLAVLPPYVPRQHDDRLAEIVTRLIDGENAIAVLVGGSSTGKTRACWEAVRSLDDGWRLWHPISPGRPEALLEGVTRVGPRSVIWLNEAQHYLAWPGSGEQIAARLRELLGDASRGPVLVLGTMWPRYWAELTAQPVDGAPDPHAQARALLTGSEIAVPDAFSGTALAALHAAADQDPRLARARNEAAEGQITQYLAGVPALLARYRTAPATAKALIHAAMDARRLGVGEALALEFLADAAPGYLTEMEWNEAADDWLEEALHYTAAPCKGVLGPLTRRKPRSPAVASDTTRYRLADYLEQTGRTERAAVLPPAAFWDAATVHAEGSDLDALALEAHARGLYRLSARLRKNAVRTGSTSAAHWLLDTVAIADPASVRDAGAWLLQQVILPDPDSAWLMARTLHKHQASELVGPLIARVAAEAALDDPRTVAALLEDLHNEEDSDSVSVLLSRDPASQVSMSDLGDVSYLLAKLKELGANDQVEKLADRAATQAAADGSYWFFSTLHHLGADRQLAEAITTSVDQIDVTDPEAVTSLIRASKKAEAEALLALLLERDLTSHVDLGNIGQLCGLLKVLHQVGARHHVATLVARLSAYAKNASAAWMVQLHGMAAELCFDRQLTSLLPREPPAAGLDPADTGTTAWLALAWMDVGNEAWIAELVDRIAAAPDTPCTLEDPASLTETLVDAGAWDLAADLVVKIAARNELADAGVAAWLLSALAGLDRRADLAALLARGPATTVSLEDAGAVAALLRELWRLGQTGQIADLLSREPSMKARLTSPQGAASLVDQVACHGARSQISALASRAALEAELGDIEGVIQLMSAIRRTGAREPLAAFAARVAAEVDLSSPDTTVQLLDAIKELALTDAAAQLLSRNPVGAFTLAFGDRSTRSVLVDLLKTLKELGAHDQVSALAARIATEAELSLAGTTADLVTAMKDVGAHDQVEALFARAANSGKFHLYLQLNPDASGERQFGRESDGTPSPRWGWPDLQ